MTAAADAGGLVTASRAGFDTANPSHVGELIAAAANTVRARGWIRKETPGYTLSHAVCIRSGCPSGDPEAHTSACESANVRLIGYLMLNLGYYSDRGMSLAGWERSRHARSTPGGALYLADSTAELLTLRGQQPRAACGYWGEGAGQAERRTDCRRHESRCDCILSWRLR